MLTTMGLALVASVNAQTSQYDPYYGFNGGWRYKDKNGNDDGGMQYDPYAGLNGGYRLRDQNGRDRGHYEWDPYLGLHGGWRYKED